MWSVIVFAVVIILYITDTSAYSIHSSNNSSSITVFLQPSRNECILPPHPPFGQWTTMKPLSQLSPGKPAPAKTVLQVNCHEDYKLDGPGVAVCVGGKWKPTIGHCSRVCPTIKSSSVMTATCKYNGKILNSCTQAPDGTIARFQCAPFYEDQDRKRESFSTCSNGTWIQSIPKCIPICGQKTVEATPLIIKGTNVTKGDYPWQIALYTKKNKELICGGTLLSQKVVLTAAQCITDNDGKLLQKRHYIVAAGKYYRRFDDSRDYNETQFSEIQAMFVARQYRGSIQNYLGDIAILVLEKTLTLSRRVQPACLDRGLNYDPLTTHHGYVTGWGFTVEYKSPSEVLKDLKIPSGSVSECENNLPEDIQIYYTSDKMCAGYLNKGTSACHGDAGGGLVFKHDGRYYVTGIVSLSPVAPTVEGGCDSHQYTLYTNVSKYINNFILEKLNEYKS